MTSTSIERDSRDVSKYPVDPRAAIHGNYGQTGVSAYDGVMIAVNAIRHDGHPRLAVQVTADGSAMLLQHCRELTERHLADIENSSVPFEGGWRIRARRRGDTAELTFVAVEQSATTRLIG